MRYSTNYAADPLAQNTDQASVRTAIAAAANILPVQGGNGGLARASSADSQRRCNVGATRPGLPLPQRRKEETMSIVEATRLPEVVYELLDAHYDTARLIAETADDDRWSAHLEYLRALQRRTRGILARTG